MGGFARQNYYKQKAECQNIICIMWEKYIHKQATLFYAVGINRPTKRLKFAMARSIKGKNIKCQLKGTYCKNVTSVYLSRTQAARQIIVLEQKHWTKIKLHRQCKLLPR